MANPEHLRRLMEGVPAWDAWREAHPDIKPDLREAYLSGANLGFKFLGSAGLAVANLRNVDLTSSNLIGANLEQADLTGATLCAANLPTATLCHANLTGANLQDVNLRFADLRGAHCCGANLSDGDLRGADLTHADLSDANLSGASLVGAIINETCLRHSDLCQVEIGRTVWTAVDLSLVKNLTAVRHAGPSSVGIDTLLKSQGNVPEIFLRGCGVPDEFLRYLPSLVEEPIHFYSGFISYSHEDKAFARLLHDRLQGQGIRCWLDEHQLLPGQDIHEEIDRGIRLWDKVLLCASQSSLTSWWVDGEINRAFQKEAQLMKERSQNAERGARNAELPSPLPPLPSDGRGEPARGGEGGRKVLALIPLDLDGFLFSADYQSGKKAEITSRVAANFVGWDKDHALFDRELEKVIRALRTDDGGREPPPATRL